jgi:hypothetical protein
MNTEQLRIGLTAALLMLAGILNCISGFLLWQDDKQRAGLFFMVAGAMCIGAGLLA